MPLRWKFLPGATANHTNTHTHAYIGTYTHTHTHTQTHAHECYKQGQVFLLENWLLMPNHNTLLSLNLND